MFALHKSLPVAVFYDRRDGMAIPVSVDLAAGVFDVVMPTVDELADDYVAYPTLAHLKRAAHGADGVIDRAARFSRHYSRLLGSTATDRSLREVREVVLAHYERCRDSVDEAIGNRAASGVRLSDVPHGEHAVTA